MSNTNRLYFVAILPPKHVYTKIRQIQHEIKNEFGCKQALKPPVHITLQAPFKRPESIESSLISGLQQFCSGFKPFDVEINGFGTFSPHTIFLKPEKTKGLMDFRQGLIQLLENEFDFADQEIGFRDFNPHFTIAYRDLKNKYPKVWETYKSKEFRDAFQVAEIFLLKHNYKFWEVLRTLKCG